MRHKAEPLEATAIGSCKSHTEASFWIRASVNSKIQQKFCVQASGIRTPLQAAGKAQLQGAAQLKPWGRSSRAGGAGPDKPGACAAGLLGRTGL